MTVIVEIKVELWLSEDFWCAGNIDVIVREFVYM